MLNNGHVPIFAPAMLGLSAAISPRVFGAVSVSWESIHADIIAAIYLASWGPHPDYAALSGIKTLVVEGADDSSTRSSSSKTLTTA